MGFAMIEFFKMSGSGNDFIVIDNKDQSLRVDDPKDFVRVLCTRKGSVGADGLIVIEPSENADFRWRFFNSDGSEAEMCGNGGRCAARFAVLKGIAGEDLSFETRAGLIDAQVRGDVVRLRLTDPRHLRINKIILIDDKPFEVNNINTGVPHVVHFVNDLDHFDVLGIGSTLRFHPLFQPDGTNVNFVEVAGKQEIRIRTYERGVEDETLACGTGTVAAALVSSWKGLVESPVDVKVRSGEMLTVSFVKARRGFEKVYLEGRVKVVYQGLLWDEAYRQG